MNMFLRPAVFSIRVGVIHNTSKRLFANTSTVSSRIRLERKLSPRSNDPSASAVRAFSSEMESTASLPHASKDGDALLLTPGPLTTSTSVKSSMMHDLGSRDSAFVDKTARVRKNLLTVVNGNEDDLTAVLLQGSGTFAVEAMIMQFVPRTGGKLLILSNGAYGRRMATICETNSRPYAIYEFPETEPLDKALIEKVLDENSDASHVAFISCETTTGVLNPVSELADLAVSRGKRVLLDAMSSFGVVSIDASVPFDAVAASSNKALQGVPGLAFVIARKKALVESAGNAESLVLDLHDQWKQFDASGEWRFTPPTHCLLAFDKALEELKEEGGVAGRRSRYDTNCKTLVGGMREFGFETLVADKDQAPVIVTFRLPTAQNFEFKTFYDLLSSKGFVIYPGKLTTEPSFRVGCIGHIFPSDMEKFLGAVETSLEEMSVSLPIANSPA